MLARLGKLLLGLWASRLVENSGVVFFLPFNLITDGGHRMKIFR